MKKGLKITPENVFTKPLKVEQAPITNPNQSMPITQKVKMSSGGTKLKG
jgi:hypothetical protein|tara:strand:+ start:2886 stop:3032 length:147 start_codon:yes stop_codon:yes gene_type:complete